MANVELVRGIVWDGGAKKEGDIITCTNAQAKWLENRDVGLIVETKPAEETKPVSRKKRAKKINLGDENG